MTIGEGKDTGENVSMLEFLDPLLQAYAHTHLITYKVKAHIINTTLQSFFTFNITY